MVDYRPTDRGRPPLFFTADEWNAFVDIVEHGIVKHGIVKHGEFG
jgi:hypothetical protein